MFYVAAIAAALVSTVLYLVTGQQEFVYLAAGLAFLVILVAALELYRLSRESISELARDF